MNFKFKQEKKMNTKIHPGQQVSKLKKEHHDLSAIAKIVG